MTTAWKIFRAVNIIEAILIAGVFIVGIYIRPPRLSGTHVLYWFSIPVIIIIAVSNTLNNINVLSIYMREGKLKRIHKIIYWVLFSCFLGFIILCVILISENFSFKNYTEDCFLIFSFMGIYILIVQIRLFILLLKKSKEKDQLLIDSIGDQLE